MSVAFASTAFLENGRYIYSSFPIFTSAKSSKNRFYEQFSFVLDQFLAGADEEVLDRAHALVVDDIAPEAALPSCEGAHPEGLVIIEKLLNTFICLYCLGARAR